MLNDATKELMGVMRAVRSVWRPLPPLDRQPPMPLRKLDKSASPFSKMDSGTLRIICNRELRFDVVFAERGKGGKATVVVVQTEGDAELVALVVTAFAEVVSLAVAFELLMMYF